MFDNLKLEGLIVLGNQNFNSQSLINLSRGCPNLQELDITGCELYGEVEPFIELGNNCPHLKIFKCYGGQFGGDNDYGINDDGLIELVRRCRELEVLSLLRCNLTDRSILEVARNCPNLKHLNLEESPKITDISMIKIAKNCPQLEELILDETSIGDKSMKHIIKLKKLKKLSVYNCQVHGEYKNKLLKKRVLYHSNWEAIRLEDLREND